MTAHHLLEFHVLPQAQDAEDLSQEVWLKAFRSWVFQIDSRFKGVRRITINAFGHHGERAFSPARSNNGRAAVQIDRKPLECVGSEETLNKLRSKVLSRRSRMTPSQRLVHSAPYEGMSTRNRNAMNCSGTVKKGSRARCQTARQAFVRLRHAETLTDFANESDWSFASTLQEVKEQ